MGGGDEQMEVESESVAGGAEQSRRGEGGGQGVAVLAQD